MINLHAGNPWQLVEQTLDTKEIHHNETLFSVSNGHIGTRGSLEEAFLLSNINENEGSYVNGFFESAPIIYGEVAYGYAQNHETICQVPNGKQLYISVDGETFSIEYSKVENHLRMLDFFQGILYREFQWTTKTGKILQIRTERFASFAHPEIIAIRYQITPINFDGELIFSAKMSPPSLNSGEIQSVDQGMDDPRVAKRKEKAYETNLLDYEGISFLSCLTNHSKRGLICTQELLFDDKMAKIQIKNQIDNIEKTLALPLKQDQATNVDVFLAYSSVFIEEQGHQAALQTLLASLTEVKAKGYDRVKQAQIAYMSEFWENSDIQIEGDDLLQKGLRINLFHLNQAAGRDGKSNISAKGLTGDGYEGHYFWDTEMYLLPFFIYTQPETAKKLLLYRHSILDKARNRARTMGVQTGALFPWRTIDGEECSAYYPAGTAQFHINADIAYAIKHYLEITNDEDFMRNEAFEMLTETARFWLAFGDYISGKDGKFCINGVTGPDEYTAVVNNNYFTNMMAQNNLAFAAKIAKTCLSEGNPRCNTLNVTLQEIEHWEDAAENMYLPYDNQQKLTMQDEAMNSRAFWDMANTPKENFPLLLHYHPLTIYRYQVNKQADTLLAELLFPERFSPEQQKRDFDYYEKITTHDSSLSRSVFSMIASRIGENEKAYNYFMDTALMDVEDIQGNVEDGIHAANMGGTWMSIIYGFAGMYYMAGKLHFTPNLPEKWSQISFRIRYHQSILEATITHEQAHFKRIQGDPVTIGYEGKDLRI